MLDPAPLVAAQQISSGNNNLGQFRVFTLYGGVTVAGVGLRRSGQETINLSGIPANGQAQHAFLTTLLLFGIWIQRSGDLSVALGILAAGLAFALQEVIGSVAGWTTIITGKPFSINWLELSQV